MEDSSQVEMERGTFQQQRIMSMYVESRKSEEDLRNSRQSSLAGSLGLEFLLSAQSPRQPG